MKNVLTIIHLTTAVIKKYSTAFYLIVLSVSVQAQDIAGKIDDYLSAIRKRVFEHPDIIEDAIKSKTVQKPKSVSKNKSVYS